MTKILLDFKNNLRLMALAIAVGSALGVVVAFGHAGGDFEAFAGQGVYPDLTHTDMSSGWPNYSFDEDHSGDADNDYPNATAFEMLDTGFWNGVADTDNVRFWDQRVFDTQGEHSIANNNWNCVKVDGINEFDNSWQWFYDEFDQQNHSVTMLIKVVKDSICPSGTGEWHHYTIKLQQ